jgi:hypothetical protein
MAEKGIDESAIEQILKGMDDLKIAMVKKIED